MSQFEYLPKRSGQSWEGRTIYYYSCVICNMQFSIPFGGDHDRILKDGHPAEECSEALAKQVHES